MSMNVNDALAKVPRRWIYIVGTALALILLLFLWLGVTKGVNGIQSFFFYRQANAKQAEVDKQLAKAAEQQKIIDQTLRDLAASKEELAKAKAAREEAERIFNDATKTAREKVAAYEAAMSAAPIHTDPAGVTTDDLCARAKAANSNPDLIRALCPQ